MHRLGNRNVFFFELGQASLVEAEPPVKSEDERANQSKSWSEHKRQPCQERPSATVALIRVNSLRAKLRGIGSSADVRGGSQTFASHGVMAGHWLERSPSQQLFPTGFDLQHA